MTAPDALERFAKDRVIWLRDIDQPARSENSRRIVLALVAEVQRSREFLHRYGLDSSPATRNEIATSEALALLHIARTETDAALKDQP